MYRDCCRSHGRLLQTSKYCFARSSIQSFQIVPVWIIIVAPRWHQSHTERERWRVKDRMKEECNCGGGPNIAALLWGILKEICFFLLFFLIFHALRVLMYGCCISQMNMDVKVRFRVHFTRINAVWQECLQDTLRKCLDHIHFFNYFFFTLMLLWCLQFAVKKEPVKKNVISDKTIIVIWDNTTQISAPPNTCTTLKCSKFKYTSRSMRLERS